MTRGPWSHKFAVIFYLSCDSCLGPCVPAAPDSSPKERSLYGLGRGVSASWAAIDIHLHCSGCLCVLEPHKKSQCSGNSHTKRPEKDEKRPLIKLDTSMPEGMPSTFQGKVKETHGVLKLVDPMQIAKPQP